MTTTTTIKPQRVWILASMLVVAAALSACGRDDEAAVAPTTPAPATVPDRLPADAPDTVPPPGVAPPVEPQSGAAPVTPADSASPAPGNPEAVEAADLAFVSGAMVSGLAEMEAGRAAADGAGDPEVKAFAERLYAEQSEANTDLAQLASSKGLTLRDAVPPATRAHLDEIAGLSGAALDRVFLRHFGVRSHEDSIVLYEHQLRDGKDAEIRAFAEKRLAELRARLELARKLEERVGAGETGGGR